MNRFTFSSAHSLEESLQEDAVKDATKFIAGGTNLIDLMRVNVERPDHVIDINHIGLNTIDDTKDGGLRLGALVKNTETAYDHRVQSRYPLLAKAILAGASPHIRNMATNAGNLLQRTRCYYFYDTSTPCNKRNPGEGCAAIHGYNRIHAILGTSDACIATHPSDMCVALAALNAVVNVRGKESDRIIPFSEFHRLPEDRPHIDSTVSAEELITGIALPPNGMP